MSREDATFVFFENFLDLDTDLGISVSDDPQKIGPVFAARRLPSEQGPPAVPEKFPNRH